MNDGDIFFYELEIDPKLKFNLNNKNLSPNIKLNFFGKLWKRLVKNTC